MAFIKNALVRFVTAILPLLGAAASGCAHNQNSGPRTQLAVPQPAPALRIIEPSGSFSLWINETEAVAAEISFDGGSTWRRSDPQHNRFVSWSANDGSYVEQIGFSTFFIAPDYEGTGVSSLNLNAGLSGDDAPATQISPTPQMGQPGTFETEIAASKSAASRDGQVEHLRRALALRPGNADNLDIEFEIGILLGQREPVRERESLAVFEGIVQKYDHANFYHADPENSAVLPELKVPRAAILAASILNGSMDDHETARKYAIIAMKDLQWTFERRRADWQNEPRPATRPFPGLSDDDDSRKILGRISYWEKRKADAAAGGIRLLGPYGEVFATAAIRQYVLSFGPETHPDTLKRMKAIIGDFPNTPMAIMATKNIESGFEKIPIP